MRNTDTTLQYVIYNPGSGNGTRVGTIYAKALIKAEERVKEQGGQVWLLQPIAVINATPTVITDIRMDTPVILEEPTEADALLDHILSDIDTPEEMDSYDRGDDRSGE